MQGNGQVGPKRYATKTHWECHPAGETLPDTTHVYKVRVVTAMLKVGIPLVKTENGFVLISSTNLRQSKGKLTVQMYGMHDS